MRGKERKIANCGMGTAEGKGKENCEFRIAKGERGKGKGERGIADFELRKAKGKREIANFECRIAEWKNRDQRSEELRIENRGPQMNADLRNPQFEIRNSQFLIACVNLFGYTLSMNRITVDSDIRNGKPVIVGTRITAQTVLEYLAAGDSIVDVIEEYLSLSREDVLECMKFSSELMKHHFVLQEVV